MNSTADRFSRFAAECRAALLADGGTPGRERVRLLLEEILNEEAFVRAYCIEPAPGLYTLYEDPVLGFQVLAHLNEKARVSPPHDHGASWAIYGQATEYTDVTEWVRSDESHSERAVLKAVKRYRLTRGRAAIYQDGIIHSIDYPDKSSFVRVTGTNLDLITRVMYDLKTGTVTQMTPQRAS